MSEQSQNQKVYSITLFGPAHSGKSTMGGFLLANHSMLSHAAIKRRQESVRLKVKERDFDYSRRYGYLFDKAMDELSKVDTSKGTTKYFKSNFIRISINNEEEIKLNILDTPGGNNFKREWGKGIYFGDAIVFLCEIRNLLSSNNREESKNNEKILLEMLQFAAPLIITGMRKLIIALTKLDLEEFSEEAFAIGEKRIKALFKFLDVDFAVIPTAIKIDKDNIALDCSHNILGKSSSMEWYRGDCLIDAIVKLAVSHDREFDATALAYCGKKMTDHGRGNVVKAKVVNGSFYTGQRVCLAPALKSGRLTAIAGSIRTMKEESARNDGGIIEKAVSGDQVEFSVPFAQKDDISHSLIIVPEKTSVDLGTCMKMRLKNNPREDYIIKRGEHISILAYGKLFYAETLSTDKEHDRYMDISIELRGKKYIAFPSLASANKENRLIVVKLRKQENGEAIDLYVDGEVIEIGVPRSMEIHAKINDGIKEEIVDILANHANPSVSCSFNEDKDRIYIDQITSYQNSDYLERILKCINNRTFQSDGKLLEERIKIKLSPCKY